MGEQIRTWFFCWGLVFAASAHATERIPILASTRAEAVVVKVIDGSKYFFTVCSAPTYIIKGTNQGLIEYLKIATLPCENVNSLKLDRSDLKQHAAIEAYMNAHLATAIQSRFGSRFRALFLPSVGVGTAFGIGLPLYASYSTGNRLNLRAGMVIGGVILGGIGAMVGGLLGGPYLVEWFGKSPTSIESLVQYHIVESETRSDFPALIFYAFVDTLNEAMFANVAPSAQ